MTIQKYFSKDQESIIAQTTSKGSGAIAMLRISGQNSFSIVSKISKLSSKKKILELKTHTIHHGYIYDNDEIIDEVLFFLMRAPKTFTGQDTIEISCHNNQFIIEHILELAINTGARMALPGEFTQRAYLNNKIDLIQAESINEIIGAQTQLSLRKSMSQLKGSLSNFFSEIEENLFSLLVIVEGSFEFFEEELSDFDINNLIKKNIEDLLKKLNELKNNFNQQQQIKDGIKISLIGTVNAGKSTLFNALLKKDRAIVTDIAGTTRDIIEASVYKNGNFWQLTDTAGLRLTDDFIEKKGIERSLEQAALADIILLVFNSSVEMLNEQILIYKKIAEKHSKKIIPILNKIDIKNHSALQKIKEEFKFNFQQVCGKNRFGLDNLENLIEEKIQKLFVQLNSPFLLNKRQYSFILELIKGLEFVKKELLGNMEYELIAYHIKDMLNNISDLTGKNINEKMLDKIFSDFCIGK